MQRVMVGDMVGRQQGVVGADRTVFASADHLGGEEVRALNDMMQSSLTEKQMGSVIYLRRN